MISCKVANSPYSTTVLTVWGYISHLDVLMLLHNNAQTCFLIFMCTVPHRGLGVPAVGTCGLFLLETRISQEMDKTACAHQVSIGTLWWEKTVKAPVKQCAWGK